jgi:hypothetical protein
MVLPLILSLPKDDGDVTLVLAFRKTRGPQHFRQGAPIDGARSFGERRMTGRHSFREAEQLALALGQAASQMKRRQTSTASAQKRHHDQARNRPWKVVLPLLAARIGHVPQDGSRLHGGSPNQEASLESNNSNIFKRLCDFTKSP